MSYRFGHSARTIGEAGSLPGDPMPSPLKNPPRINRKQTRSEQKKNAERVTDLAVIREDYEKRVQSGVWEQTKQDDPEYGEAVDRLIGRGSIKRHPADKTPPVTPPAPGMGELQKSQWRPRLYPASPDDSVLAGAAQRFNVYSARLRGDPEAAARAAGQTGRGGFTFGQQAGNVVAPAAAGALAAAPALALPFPANLIAGGVLGYIGYDTARRVQELADEEVLGTGPARQMEASQSYNESQNPLQAIAGRFVGNLAGMRQKPSPKDISLVVQFFRGQLAKGTPEYVHALTTVAQSGVGTGVGAAGNVATQLHAIRDGSKESFDILPLLAEAGLNAAPTTGIGSRAKGPMARPKSFDLPNPPRTRPVAGMGETLGPPSPPPGPKPPAKVVKQEPAAPPAAKPSTTPKDDKLEPHVQAIAAKYAKGEDVESTTALAKRLGITREEALEVKQRAADTIEVKRQAKAQNRGRAKIPVQQPEPQPEVKPDAVPVVKSAETVLPEKRPEVGLPKVGSGDAEGQTPTAKVEAPAKVEEPAAPKPEEVAPTRSTVPNPAVEPVKTPVRVSRFRKMVEMESAAAMEQGGSYTARRNPKRDEYKSDDEFEFARIRYEYAEGQVAKGLWKKDAGREEVDFDAYRPVKPPPEEVAPVKPSPVEAKPAPDTPEEGFEWGNLDSTKRKWGVVSDERFRGMSRTERRDFLTDVGTLTPEKRAAFVETNIEGTPEQKAKFAASFSQERATPDTPEGKAQAYVDSLAEMPNKRMGPKPFAQRYLDWKKGGMKGERPSAGAEGITPAAVRKVEKAIDEHMGPTPSPNAKPAPKSKNPSVEQRRRGGQTGMINPPVRKNKPASDESLVKKDDAEKYDVSRTSVNQIPAVHRAISWVRGKVNVDLGGGKFDKATDYLRDEHGVENVVVDKYSRDEAHNTKALARVREVGGGDTGTVANVLNVISDPKIRRQVLEQAKALVKPGGKIRISVYEGDGKGVGKATSAGTWQENRRTRDYLGEVQAVFPDAKLVGGKYIEATNPTKTRRVGKEIGGAVYVHRNYESSLPPSVVDQARSRLPVGFDYTVVKYDKATGNVTFTNSPDWDSSPEPVVGDSYLVKPDGSVRFMKQQGDPYVYHRKHEFVGDDYSGFDVVESRRRSDEIDRVPGVDKTRIGRKSENDRIVAKIPKRPRSVEQMRRGSQRGMAGAQPKHNRPAPGPDAEKNRNAVNQEGEPSILGRIISHLLPGGKDAPYRPSVSAVVKQGLRSDFAVPQEAADILAKRQGISRNEKKFAAEGGLDPSQRPDEMARRTRQVHDVLDDVLENGPRDKKDKPIGPGIGEAFKPLTEDAKIGGRKLTPAEVYDHYQTATEDAVARRVVSRGKRIDDEAADEYADAVGAVVDAEAIAKNATQRKAAAAMRADLPNVKKKIDDKAAERKNNIIGYRDKTTGETDVDVATRALKEYEAAYPETIKEIREVGDRMESYARSILKYAVEHGRLSQTQYDDIVKSEDFYTPLRQLVDSEFGAALPGVGGAPKPLGKSASVAKGFGYGEKPGLVENPFEEIISQTERIVREVERNKVMQGFRSLAADPQNRVADIVEILPGNKLPRRGDQIDENAMKRDGIVRVYVDGKTEYLKFSTKDRFGISLAKIMTNFDPREDVAMRIANFMTNVQKRLITLHPGFAVTQYLRDRGERFVLSQHVGVKDLKGEYTPPDKEQLSRERRFPSGQTANRILDERANYKQVMDKVLTEAGVKKKGAMYYIRAPKKVYEHIISMGERQNRRTEFRAAFDYAKGKGLDDYEAGLYASSQSTKLQDFTEKGTVARYVLDPLIPFYSASVEGVSRGAAALRRDPVKTGLKAALVGAIPAFVIMTEREKNGTVKDLFEFPVYQRATGYIPDTRPDMNNTVPWIPKPHAVSFLSAVIEHQYALDWADRGITNPDERKAFKERVAKSMKETLLTVGSPVDMESIFSSGPMGTGMQLYFNRNVFGDKEIVPHDEKQVPTSQRPGREGKSPLVANPTKWINQKIPPEKWQDARFTEFALERFLGRWMTGAENISRIMDPEEKRKALEQQSFFRKVFPLIKDEPGPFSTSMVELEKGVREATPVNPTLKQRIIKSRMGPAAPDTMVKRHLYKMKSGQAGFIPEDEDKTDEETPEDLITSYYNATTNKEVSAAARNMRKYPDRRFAKGSVRRAVKLPPPVPTRKESERKKRALNELLNRRD